MAGAMPFAHHCGVDSGRGNGDDVDVDDDHDDEDDVCSALQAHSSPSS